MSICNSKSTTAQSPNVVSHFTMTTHRIDYFSEFNPAKHFRGKVHWDKIKDLKGSDFLWEILEPISKMIKDDEHEEERVKRLSPGQKALHFFWYLDAQVTNGGFIQFYWNGYDAYLPSLKKGLELIGYTELLEVVIKSEQEYDSNIDKFNEWKDKDDWEWLYDNLKEFEKLDDWYYSKNEHHYSIFESHIRQNLDSYVLLK